MPVTLASCCRDRRDRHRSKSRDGSRGDKSVTIQAPGEPLLDNESTRGDERVSVGMMYRSGVSGLTFGEAGGLPARGKVRKPDLFLQRPDLKRHVLF